MEGGSIWEGGESPALAKCFLDNLSLQPFRNTRCVVLHSDWGMWLHRPPGVSRQEGGMEYETGMPRMSLMHETIVCACIFFWISMGACVQAYAYLQACMFVWVCMCLHVCENACVFMPACVGWEGQGCDHVSASDPPSQISVVTFQTRTHRETGHFLLKAPRAPTRLYRSISHFVSIES